MCQLHAQWSKEQASVDQTNTIQVECIFQYISGFITGAKPHTVFIMSQNFVS